MSVSVAQLVQRRTAALKHGASSEARIVPAARAQRRRLLRRIGLKASDLDGIGAGYLESWSRCTAKVEMLDRWIAEHGLVNEQGETPGFMALYVSLVNSSRLSLDKLASHLKQRDGDVDSFVSALSALELEGHRMLERTEAA